MPAKSKASVSCSRHPLKKVAVSATARTTKAVRRLADWAFGLFRSDPEAPRHAGLTYFLFPLNAKGVTVRPIRQLDGEAGFAEIFCDDVFVPDRDVLGVPGSGWKVAMSTTGSERGLTLRSPGRFLAAADRLAGLARRDAAPQGRSGRARTPSRRRPHGCSTSSAR